MASLVFGAIGAGIGYAIGPVSILGMSSVSLGWSLGSSIGNLLTREPVVTEGPRLHDLKVQVSTYGNAIPRVWGSYRVAGNVIWSKPIKETRHEEEIGGKGGPEAVSITYTYSQTFAVAICEGPISAIGRIWANGEVIYDHSGQSGTAGEFLAGSVGVYLGTETQQPDPVIEADLGAGNTPAYRGTAYVVFYDLQLQKFGNRTPNIEVEVFAQSSNAGWIRTVTRSVGASIIHVDRDTGTLSRATGLTGNRAEVSTIPLGASERIVTAIMAGPNVLPNQSYAIGKYPHEVSRPDMVPMFWNDRVDIYFLTDYATGTPSPYLWRSYSFPWSNMVRLMMKGGRVFIVRFMNVGGQSQVIVHDCDAQADIITAPLGSADAYISDDRIYVMTSTSQIDCYDHSGTLLWTVTASSLGLAIFFGDTLRADNDGMAVMADDNVGGPGDRWLYFSPTGSLVHTSAAGSGYIALGQDCVLVGKALVGSNGELLLNTAAGSAVSASSIITDICGLVGLPAADLTFIGTVPNITGYAITNRTTARALLEQICQIVGMDAVESDGKLKFCMRGGTSTSTVPESDLVVNDDQVALTVTREQPRDLPSEIIVTYLDKDAGYNIGSQRAVRMAGSDGSSATVQLPAVLTATDARRIAERLVHEAWERRTSYTFTLPLKYSTHEPTDVVSVPVSGVSVPARIMERYDDEHTLRLKVVKYEAGQYSQVLGGATNSLQATTLQLVGTTILYVLDCPLLREEDDGIGMYVSGFGTSPYWQGALVHRSADGNVWTPTSSPIRPGAVIGRTYATLGNWTGGSTWDVKNEVYVTVNTGTFQSRSDDEVLSGANAILVGNEVLQFRTATALGGSNWKLSGLLRGRLGTEDAIGTHGSDEPVILLSSASVSPLQCQITDVNALRWYRPMTVGARSPDAAKTVIWSGRSLKPLAPVYIKGDRNTAGDVMISWVRRTRYDGSWRDGGDVPIGEAYERYEVDVLKAGTPVRTLVTTTASVEYTAAMQVDDFGSTQASLSIVVYQISDRIGRGMPATATV